MDTLSVSISPYEANLALDGYVFTVTAIVNGRSLPDWLDVDEFFSSLHQSGRLPIFNCSCGCLGCGGYYMDVHAEARSVTWANRYKTDGKREAPFDDCFYRFAREDIRNAAGELLATLYTITGQNPGAEVRSGTTGVDLAERLPYYQQQYDSLQLMSGFERRTD